MQEVETEPRASENLCLTAARLAAFDLSARAVFVRDNRLDLEVKTPFTPPERPYYVTLDHFLTLNSLDPAEAERRSPLFDLFVCHKNLFLQEFKVKNQSTTYDNFLKRVASFEHQIAQPAETVDVELKKVLARFNHLSRYAAENFLLRGFNEYIHEPASAGRLPEADIKPLLQTDLFKYFADEQYWLYYATLEPRRIKHFIHWLQTAREAAS